MEMETSNNHFQLSIFNFQLYRRLWWNWQTRQISLALPQWKVFHQH